jgi:hypothetical protein
MSSEDIADFVHAELVKAGRMASRVERNFPPLAYVISEQHDDNRFLSVDCNIEDDVIVGITFSYFVVDSENFDSSVLKELIRPIANATVEVESEDGWLRRREFATLTMAGYEPVRKVIRESSFIVLQNEDLVSRHER